MWKVKVSFPFFFFFFLKKKTRFLLSNTSRIERPEGFNANNLEQFRARLVEEFE